MKLLVFGAGVIGSLYAAKLREAGHTVTILARGRRAADLRVHGIVLEDATTRIRTTTPVDVIERLAHHDAYDLLMVVVRNDQLGAVLPIVAANRATPTVLVMVNNVLGPNALIELLGRDRVLLGFPGAGGTREGTAVRYHVLSARQQATTIGELDGQRTPRIELFATAFRQAGFPVAISSDMDSWLKTHVVWTCPAVHALYMGGGSCESVAHTRDAVILWVRAVREGYRALRALGSHVTPPSLRAFELVPEPLFVAFLQRLMASPTADLVLARHAAAARAEYVQLGEEFLSLARRAGIATPAFDRLRPFVDPSVPPVAVGSATLSPRWGELWPWVGALGVVALSIGLWRRHH